MNTLTPRMGALAIPLLLSACMCVAGTAQARDISVTDGKGHYLPYKPGMALPKGVAAPLDGYSHADLLLAAAQPIEAQMKARGLDPTLTRESLFAMAGVLNEALEARSAEYQIATDLQKAGDSPKARHEAVTALAKHFGLLTVDATYDSLKGSPLLSLDKQFLNDYINNAGNGVASYIMKLDTAAR
ncbi:hypothetical protein JAK44_09970 [Stenotrophomonas maltophilia]|uniref:hypothetical protein n=1 Tax=Stenotrophomonas TaxID=40323 RepID=UPI0021C9E26B|nr:MULTISPECIES: hypothetical protein [Stenotrophomonas]MCU1001271.1 hypothetical protein [Stenotrophomonas maltophilia]